MTSPRVEDLLRELAPQVLGVLARRYGDFAAAEDAVQEALLSAAVHWPVDGVPGNPRGWLLRTGTRKLIDALRADQARRHREELAAVRDLPTEAYHHDDTLTVLFLCCHPDLTPGSAIALTLRAVGGLSTAEIARAFLVPEATMGQRIGRAKQRIAGLPLDQPGDLARVLRVLYLIFNEGYTSRTAELSGEAIRLTRTLHRLVPDDPEVGALLALMLLNDSRRPARTGPDGELVPLADQDRTLWDKTLIARGTALLDHTITTSTAPVGEYQLQAAIAALHARAARVEDTDWPQILGLYGMLETLTGNPVVALNRAVALAMVHGPAAGLRALDGLDGRLPGNHRLASVRAHLSEQAGDLPTALAHYQAAAAATTSLPERHYLTTQAARLASTLRSAAAAEQAPTLPATGHGRAGDPAGRDVDRRA